MGLPGEDLDYDDIWDGMPDYQEEPAVVREGGQIIVHFRNNEDRLAFGRLLEQGVTPKTRFLWFPVKERQHPSDFLITDDES